MDAPDTPQAEETRDSGIGPMAGIVIVVLLLAAGGIFFLMQEYQRAHTPPVQEYINA